MHPGKATGNVKIVGTSVSLTGGMFDLLNAIYAKSDTECDVDITFSPTSDGKQQNDCRDLVVAYMSKPDLPKGRKIAERLAEHSDGRSGLGLLFLIAGKEGRDHKIVLSRFPTDSAIYVDETPGTLSVQFLERVFTTRRCSTGTRRCRVVFGRAAQSTSNSIRCQANHLTTGSTISSCRTSLRRRLWEHGASR